MDWITRSLLGTTYIAKDKTVHFIDENYIKSGECKTSVSISVIQRGWFVVF